MGWTCMAKIIIEVTCGDPKVASLALSQEKEKKGLADKTRPRETEELSRKLNEQWEIYMGDKSTKRWFRLGILFPKIFRPHWEALFKGYLFSLQQHGLQ